MTTNSHWTEAQLDALYKRASIPTMEHFLERQAIMEADGGLDPLAAANANEASVGFVGRSCAGVPGVITCPVRGSTRSRVGSR